MKIAIIGAGNVGSALGQGWAKAGHTVIYGVRNPGGGKTQPPSAAGISSMLVPDAVKQSEVVVIAVPWNAVEDATKATGELNKIVGTDISAAYKAAKKEWAAPVKKVMTPLVAPAKP